MSKIDLNSLKEHVTQERKKRYAEYLLSPEWCRLRNAVLERDYYCRCCHVNLSVDAHHLTYVRIFHERLTDLVGVCRDCHKTIHEELEAKKNGGAIEGRQAA